MDAVFPVIDLRSRSFFEELQDTLVELENTKMIETNVLFLDASDEELVSFLVLCD